MKLEEAIEWANYLARPKTLFGRGSTIIFYVCPWNDGFIVHSESHLKRHPDITYVYDTEHLLDPPRKKD